MRAAVAPGHRQYPADAMRTYPVGPLVSNPSNVVPGPWHKCPLGKSDSAAPAPPATAASRPCSPG
jgi:hypothetical protein